MKKRLMQLVMVAVVLLAAAQLIRPDLSGPPADSRRSIQAQLGSATALAAVLERSCGDCHSNQPARGWYTNVAPASWLMAYAVREGRKVINFSEWAGYTPQRRQELLAMSCSDVSAGKMPGAYTIVRPDTKLVAENIETICAAARPVRARAGDAR